MLGKISLMLVIALIGAGMMSTTVLNKQHVVAKSSDEIGQMLQNMSKLGVVITSTPVMCNSIGDIMGAISGQVSGVVGGNLANMTSMGNLSASAPETMMSMMNKTGSLNQTNDMQGMLTNLINQTMVSGTENMTDSLLGKVKDLMLCSPTTEKKIENMLK
jgi:hypothetical protein